MKKIFLFILVVGSLNVSAQNTALKPGDAFPDIVIKPVINAPVTALDINTANSDKFYILNFWGTWCSPCIPEMDALAKLQHNNQKTIQVIGVSDDSPERLRKYLVKKPSGIWLASDTSSFIYKAMGFSYVGQSAVINNKHQIVALVKTDSVNQQMINDLLAGKKVRSSAQINEQPVTTAADLFGTDSTLSESFTLRGFMKGQRSMGRRYITPPYNGRRVSYINACITTMYKDAFDITSSKQVIYEIAEKEACDFENKASLYCFDLLVPPAKKDSLHHIMQERLLAVLPVKARIEQRSMPVYILKAGDLNKLMVSKNDQLSYGFSGKGFEGTGVTLTDFASLYLSNEMELPVLDETGITKRFDVKTNVTIRTRDGLLKSIAGLGLGLEKAERKMKVLVLYK